MKYSYPYALFKKPLNEVNAQFAFFLKKYTPRRNFLFKAIVATSSASVFTVVILYVLVISGSLGPLPTNKELLTIENPVATKIYSSDSILIDTYYSQNRLDLKPYEITPLIEGALISTEDERFYSHDGIDYKSLLRVLIKTILLGDKDSGGGSTITQQLVKNLYPRKDYWLGSIVINKLREMIIAKKLEKRYSKQQILHLYLNTVPFGEQTYGIKTGSLRYFNKTPEKLKTEEAALLVGMLKGPSLFNPRINYENAFRRRNIVLNQMEKMGMLNSLTRDSLMNLPINLNYHRLPSYAGIAPYFKSHLLKQTAAILDKINHDQKKDYNLRTDGLSIYTSIDSRFQSYAEQAVNEQMSFLQREMDRQWKGTNWDTNPALSKILHQHLKETADSAVNEKQKTEVFEWSGEKDTIMTAKEKRIHDLSLLQTGFIVMDVKSGAIKAWVGRTNYKHFKYDHVLARRQVGSTFKPFLYLTALRHGYTACDMFFNDTISYSQFENWSPRNADRTYGGAYTLKGTLTHSVNTVSAHLILKVSLSNVLATAKNAGIQSTLPRVPSIALGTAELSLYEMVQAYQTLANYGCMEPTKIIQRIEDKNSKIIYSSQNEKNSTKAIAQKSNHPTLIEMLENVVKQGTASSRKYKYHLTSEIAGKTGTTQNDADTWFIGFNPDLVAGSWVGSDYPAIH